MLSSPAPAPCAEALRQQVSQLRAEAKESQEQLSGLQETLAQANGEKEATGKELASCRDGLSKATGERGWAAVGQSMHCACGCGVGLNLHPLPSYCRALGCPAVQKGSA